MEVLKKFNIKAGNPKLYEQALTHSSYSNEEYSACYERLEFLGDAVFELIITDYLFKNYSDDEGIMTKLRAHYACEDALYVYSTKLKLNDYLKLGKGELESGGKYRKAIVADIFESFLGALYLDQGFVRTKKFVYKYIIPIIESGEMKISGDYKTELQELTQTDKRNLEYIILKDEGPPHNKKYTIAVKIDEITYGVGSDRSKKGAEQKAAKEALNKIAK